MDVNPLAARRCQALEGQAALTATQVVEFLAQAPGWSIEQGAIEKRFEFTDYHRTLAFVNALAWVAHTEDHHPDLRVSYGHCTVRFCTHSVGGISINDFICAAKVDALAGQSLS